MIVFDTDILSMFAKIDAVDLLKHLFDEKAVITPKIRDEISVPLQAILKALWKKKIKSKEEVKQILEKIKKADNLEVSREVKREIFEE